jgi:hypothetical protein
MNRKDAVVDLAVLLNQARTDPELRRLIWCSISEDVKKRYSGEEGFLRALRDGQVAAIQLINGQTLLNFTKKLQALAKLSRVRVPDVVAANRLRQTGAGGFPGSADEAYDAIRSSTTDVADIANSTGIKPTNIQKVKDHVFFNQHLLDRYVDQGIPAYLSRFDSHEGIVAAWQRLSTGNGTSGDMDLLRHEAAEAWYMRKHGPSYNAAHEAAQQRYPSGF